MKYLKTYEGFRILNEEIFGLFGSNNGQKRYQKLVDKDLISFIQNNSKELVNKFSTPWKKELIQDINNEEGAKNILNGIKNESSLDEFIKELEIVKKYKSKSSIETPVGKTQSSQKEVESHTSSDKDFRKLRDFLGEWSKGWNEIIKSEFVEDIQKLYNFLVWSPKIIKGLLEFESYGLDETCRSIKFLKLIKKYDLENLSREVEELGKKVLSLREELFGEIKKYLPSFDIDNPESRDMFFSRIDNNNTAFHLKDFLEEYNLFSRNEYSRRPIHQQLEIILENLKKFSSVSDIKELALAILGDKKLIVDRNGFVTYHGSDRDYYGNDKFASTIKFKKRKGLGLFTSDLDVAIEYAIAHSIGGMTGTKVDEGDKISVYRITLGKMPFLLDNENELTQDEINILLDFGFGGLDGIGQTDKERELIIVTPDAIEKVELISQGDKEFDKILSRAKENRAEHQMD